MKALTLVNKGEVTWAQAQSIELIRSDNRQPPVDESDYAIIETEAKAQAKLRSLRGSDKDWNSRYESSDKDKGPKDNGNRKGNDKAPDKGKGKGDNNGRQRQSEEASDTAAEGA